MRFVPMLGAALLAGAALAPGYTSENSQAAEALVESRKGD